MNIPDDQIQGCVITLDLLVRWSGIHGAIPATDFGVAGVAPQLQPRHHRHVGGKPLHG